MTKEKIKKIIEKTIKKLQKNKKLSKFNLPEIEINYPENKLHGDYSSNIAMLIAKCAKEPPFKIARVIKEELSLNNQLFFSKIEIAGPGFINFFLSKKYLQEHIKEILKQEKDYGKIHPVKSLQRKFNRVNIEFISANPTGPLTLGNGRGGFCGDVLANILDKAGYQVIREYYINDIGEQVRKLGHSILGDKEAVYKGDYINRLREKIKEKDAEKAGQKAAKIILKEIIKPSIKKMGIKFDYWFSEKKLYQTKEIDKVLKWLKKKRLSYEKEGVLWFKSSHFNDDKDRVLIKSNGQNTYLVSDIAYLKNKIERGFDKIIYFWGADHHGYIGRVESAARAFGFKKEKLDIIIMQLVRLFEKGKEIRMSKRSGLYLTIDELIEAIGLDTTRFFFLTKNPTTHLNFNLDLAKEQSEKNPVYYIQYAYARICSILRKASSKKKGIDKINQELSLLNHEKELELIKQLIKFPEIVKDTAYDYQVQRLPQYALDLANAFHQFYNHCRVLDVENKKLSQARLALVLSTKIVLKNTLDLMGISAPSKM